jgi:hypothetical protein
VSSAFVKAVFSISIVLNGDQKRGMGDEATLPKEGMPPEIKHLGVPRRFGRSFFITFCSAR